jgi:limonene-1,2-epoxide hydrolase
MSEIPRRTLGALAVAAAATAVSPATGATPMTDHLPTYHSLIEAWKKKDIDAVLAKVTDDFEWHYLVGLPPLSGKDAARKFLEKFGSSIAEVRWRVFDAFQKDNKIVVEGVDEYSTTTGGRVAVPYIGILEFRDGKIAKWRDYCDSALAGRMKNGEAVPAYVEKLIDRKAI